MSSRTIEGRCFPNPFASSDESSGEPQFIESETHTISENYCSKLRDEYKDLCFHFHRKSPKRGVNQCVYTGQAGIAFALLKSAMLAQDDTARSELLGDAEKSCDDVMLQHAMTDKSTYGSVIVGAAGVILVHALIRIARAQGSSQHIHSELIQAFKSYFDCFDSALRCDSDEWLYGRVGYLHGLELLYSISPDDVPTEKMSHLADAVVESGRLHAGKIGCNRDCPLMWKWCGENYIGAAHGVVGILFILLHVPSVFGGQKRHKDAIVQTLLFLEHILSKHENLPPVLEDEEFHLVHFCHGAPGAVFLFLRAFQVYGDEKWLRAAQIAAGTVWRHGLLRKGGSLCHGIAGNGYALLAMYKETSDPVWLDRAVYFALNLTDKQLLDKCHSPDNPDSLFEVRVFQNRHASLLLLANAG
eukprot:GHVQ01023585.1.p1 GENE.GHVQ01023585.1~~GHVQ01023585.1.p1  ORF type:complete len:415 (+),score=41.24 GHVQ01023585.1:2260-3504(+)